MYIKSNTWAVVTALAGLLAIGAVLLSVNSPRGRRQASPVPETTLGATVSTQPTYAGKVDEVRRQDGVPLVEVNLTEGPVKNHKELAIASTNLVVGDVVRLVWVSAPGGKYFPVARLIGATNSWP